jgi:DNA-binding MarR family transcriptional regulator
MKHLGAVSPKLRVEPVLELGDTLDFLRVIWSVDHGLHRASKRAKVELGVTGPQLLVLCIVGRFPGLPAGQLARLLHVHPSTLSGVLKRLEKKSLLRRRNDPRDRRRALLGLTSKGRALDLERPGPAEAAVRKTLARVPHKKVAAAREVLEALAQALGEP